jgi:hypothetical protein
VPPLLRGGCQEQEPTVTPREAAAAAAFARRRIAWHPAALAVTGLGGITVILWLMVFQPF